MPFRQVVTFFVFLSFVFLLPFDGQNITGTFNVQLLFVHSGQFGCDLERLGCLHDSTAGAAIGIPSFEDEIADDATCGKRQKSSKTRSFAAGYRSEDAIPKSRDFVSGFGRVLSAPSH